MEQPGTVDGRELLPVLQARRVLLRQPAPSDVAARLEVPRDPEEYRMYGGSGSPKSVSEAELATVLGGYARQDTAKERAFVLAARVWPDGRAVDHAAGRYIGTARLHGISWEDRKARFAIGIFDRRFWSHGFGSEATNLMLAFGFDQLRLHRIDLRVLDFNTRAIRCYEKCGFSREGVERDSALVNGTWHSDLIMGILEDEYRSRQEHATP